MPPVLIIKYLVDFIWKWCAAGSQQPAFRLFAIFFCSVFSFFFFLHQKQQREISSARILTIKLALSNKCLCSTFQTHVPALQRPTCARPHRHITEQRRCYVVHVEHQIKYQNRPPSPTLISVLVLRHMNVLKSIQNVLLRGIASRTRAHMKFLQTRPTAFERTK